MDPKVIVIVGPTGSGKTSLSLKIASRINSEIISADSRQVFKYLNIGTAKPTAKEMSMVRHHLVDFLLPTNEYNSSKFEKEALKIISQLHKESITPIVVGGSGLYVKALIDGIFDSVDTDEQYRDELMEKRSKYGNDFLYNMLLSVDPKTAENLLPQNWKRVIRALEVYHITGEPIWKHQENYKRNINYQFLQFGLNWPREVLYEKIEARVDQMIKDGLVEEVENLISKGYNKTLNSLNTVGYKEIIEFLEQNITLDRAIELMKRNTRRYAKRQLTWFRKDKRITWFDIKSDKDFENVSKVIISNLYDQ